MEIATKIGDHFVRTSTLIDGRPFNMRRKVKFLTVVWGEAYIARFASLALPSFIAPGNLPALAEATDLEVVIMTRRSDFAYFESNATFHRLKSICSVRFVEIDDLITTGVYGVTLTLAYARPIIALGSEMLETHFVFMNADFVLGDGSLRSLLKHIEADRSIVLGPSFRATAEEVEPLLEAAIDNASGLLSIPPRQMAKLALPHPHPTTVAKIVNQDLCHATHPNQFFWRIDEQTLLGRYYLIFMLCLKPERVISTVNSFCDYALIPEMCPSGNEAAIENSDEFFMLELQERNQEKEMLRLGRQPEHETVKSLQYWTTAEHRRAAKYDILFHASDIPPDLDSVKAKAQAFIDKIQSSLDSPISHVDHKYWTQGVEAWKSLRKSKRQSFNPPELASSRGRFYTRLSWFVAYNGQKLILGETSRLSPYWADDLLLSNTLETILRDQVSPVLIIRDNPETIDRLAGTGSNIDFATMREALSAEGPLTRLADRKYAHIFIYCRQNDCRHTKELLKQCRSALDNNGTCSLFVNNRDGESNDGLSPALIALVEGVGTGLFRIESSTFVGGRFKNFTRNLFRRMGRSYVHYGNISLLWLLPVLAISVPLVFASNFYQRHKTLKSLKVVSCSSMVIQLTVAK